MGSVSLSIRVEQACRTLPLMFMVQEPHTSSRQAASQAGGVVFLPSAVTGLRWICIKTEMMLEFGRRSRWNSSTRLGWLRSIRTTILSEAMNSQSPHQGDASGGAFGAVPGSVLPHQGDASGGAFGAVPGSVLPHQGDASGGAFGAVPGSVIVAGFGRNDEIFQRLQLGELDVRALRGPGSHGVLQPLFVAHLPSGHELWIALGLFALFQLWQYKLRLVVA